MICHTTSPIHKVRLPLRPPCGRRLAAVQAPYSNLVPRPTSPNLAQPRPNLAPTSAGAHPLRGPGAPPRQGVRQGSPRAVQEPARLCRRPEGKAATAALFAATLASAFRGQCVFCVAVCCHHQHHRLGAPRWSMLARRTCDGDRHVTARDRGMPSRLLSRRSQVTRTDEAAEAWLRSGVENVELRTELTVQLLKQIHRNPNGESAQKVRPCNGHVTAIRTGRARRRCGHVTAM